MCLDAKIKLEHLLSYSPDYNPIEEAFAELKTNRQTTAQSSARNMSDSLFQGNDANVI